MRGGSNQPMPSMGIIVGHGPGYGGAPSEMIVPPRVVKALEFLELSAFKGMTRAAANDVGIELIPGQPRTDEEETAFASACNLLSKYFAGKLPVDQFERVRLDEAKQDAKGDAGTSGTALACPACMGNGRIDAGCELCEGSGHVITRPLRRRAKKRRR